MSVVPSLGADRPLCFLHIPKTGGTSLTDAIARHFPPDRVFSEGGNVTVDYLQRQGERLAGRAFIAGHAGRGVADYLCGKADFITVLRRPEDHAVSNYLHVLSEPHNPLYASANRLSFSDYLRENVDQICFQANSLCVALSTDEVWIDPLRQNRIDVLLRFLDATSFVGVIERTDVCVDVLSRMIPVEGRLELPYLNAAVSRGISTATLDRLRREYQALKADPVLVYPFALESLVYAKAEATLERLRRNAGADAAAPAARSNRLFVGARRFSSATGVPSGEDMICPLAKPGRHLVYGPYDRFPEGKSEVEFHLGLRDAKGKVGLLRIDVVANGKRRLAGGWLSAAKPPSIAARTLAFYNDDAANVLEFRVRAWGFGRGKLVFRGATVSPAKPRESWLRRLTRPFAAPGVLSRRLG